MKKTNQYKYQITYTLEDGTIIGGYSDINLADADEQFKKALEEYLMELAVLRAGVSTNETTLQQMEPDKGTGGKTSSVNLGDN